LSLLAPELSWLLLVPALLIVLLGIIGICSSWRVASQLFRAQLAVFLLVLAAMLAGAGCFAYVSADATAQWILDGCKGQLLRGTWAAAGRIAGRMRRAHHDYGLLRSGLEVCRALNPLVYDLADCGVRARLEGGGEASEVSLFGWFQHVQVAYACGGFCKAEVPLFGLADLGDTLAPRRACAPKASAAVRALGHIFGIFGALMAVPVAGISMVLFRAAGEEDDEYEEVELSDPDGGSDCSNGG